MQFLYRNGHTDSEVKAMKQIWFRPPHIWHFSMDEDDAPGRLVHRPPQAPPGAVRGRRAVRVSPLTPGAMVCRRRRAHGAHPAQAARPQHSGARRAFLRAFDRYGYYVAVGICALMVFAGAAAGVMGYGELNAEPAPAPSAVADELTGDVSAAQASAGGLPAEEPVAESAARLAMWPLEGEVLTGHETGRLVYQETLGLYATHAGIDIAGARGQVAVACADGEIARCWRESLLGNVVELRTGEGVVARYANLMSLDLVSEGDRVRAGDAIGAIGASAMSEALLPPHLHFEVWAEGESVPPLEWLPEAQAAGSAAP